MKKIENPAQFMHDAGLLYKINIDFMHPLGLALYYSEKEDGTIEIQGLGVQDFGEKVEGYTDPQRAISAEYRYKKFLEERKDIIRKIEKHVDVPKFDWSKK